MDGKVMDLSKCGGVCKGSCKHYAIGEEYPPEATFEPVKVKPMNLADVKEWMQITEDKGGIGRRDLMEWLIAEVEQLSEDREWQIKQNVKMFTALEEISNADGTPEKPKHVSRSALIQIAKEGMIEAV